MTPHYQGLLCDFDGTLHTQDYVVSENVVRALQRLVAQGIPVGICTGRQYEFIRPFLEAYDLKGAHVVCCGAQLMNFPGDIIQERSIPGEVMQPVARFIDSLGGYLLLKQTHATYANEIALRVPHAPIAMQPISEVTDWTTPAFYVTNLTDGDWLALAALPGIHLIKQRFRSGKPGFFADGVAPGVSKASGAMWWCAYHGLDTSRVIAIGDGENDIDLLQSVGLGLGMGNAVPELKAAADAVIPSIDEDGVRWAIDRYFP